MKRISNTPAESPQSRQKFENLVFNQGQDPFENFYISSPHKIPKEMYSFPPFQELSLWNHSTLYQALLHSKLNTSEASPLLSLMSNYLDCLLLNSNSSLSPIDDIYLHVLNHIYKHKEKIKKNSLTNSPIKDQGFTSALILILVPTQLHAKKFLEFIVKVHCKDNWKKVGKFSRKKYQEIFEDNEENNNSDAIKLGISLGEKDVNFFTSFKKCDIILATPLSLKQGITKDEENFDKGILCSIQIAVVIESHLLLMQNWDHIEDIFKNMNLIPDRDSVMNDINRIRDEFLEGLSKNYRQLIMHTEFLTPILMSIFNRNSNCRGKAKTIEHYQALSIGSSQKFRKFMVNDIKEGNSKRFEYFCEFWGKIKEDLPPKSVIFVQNYFEFVQIKNYLEENDPGVNCICEYTKKPERQRAIALWNAGTSKALCITERLIYFRPLHLKSIGKIVFFSLPIFKEFYEDLVTNSSESISLFSKYDGFALQRIVGDSKADKMVISSSEIFSIN